MCVCKTTICYEVRLGRDGKYTLWRYLYPLHEKPEHGYPDARYSTLAGATSALRIIARDHPDYAVFGLDGRQIRG